MTPNAVVALLENQHELTDPARTGNGGNLTGLTLMPHAQSCAWMRREMAADHNRVHEHAACNCHLRDYRELHRLLERMRNDRTEHLLTLNGEHVSVRALRWHVVERYLKAEHSRKTVRYIRDRPIGIVTSSYRNPGKLRPLESNEHVPAYPPVASWDTVVASDRRRRSNTPADHERTVVRWSHQVNPAKAAHGVAWLADNWVSVEQPSIAELAAA